MKANETYFHRNRGSWNWNTEFKVTDARGLWSSQIPTLAKLRISLFAIAQNLFGPFNLHTHVDFQINSSVVRHSTVFKKWGITFYRSEKLFRLRDDGVSITLEGDEFFWPLNQRAVPFSRVQGKVDESTTSATYTMPMAGTTCDCRVVFDRTQCEMVIKTPWMQGRFWLTPSSREVLESRFD